MEFETFVIIVTVALVFVFITVASARGAARGGQRLCAACGAAHPPFAQFCRRCGQRLKE